MYVIMKNNMFKWSFWSELQSCNAFYIIPNCIRNQYTEFEIDRAILILTCLNKWINKPKQIVIFFKMDLKTNSLWRCFAFYRQKISIIPEKFKAIEQFNIFLLTNISSLRTDGRIIIIENLHFSKSITDVIFKQHNINTKFIYYTLHEVIASYYI